MPIDKLGRTYFRFFDKYGNKTFTENDSHKNRRALVMERTKPSNKPKGGYRAKPPKRGLREFQI